MAMRRLRLALWPLAVLIGIAAEWYAYGAGDLRHAVPDIAVGWTFIACGLICWARRPESRSGVLMAAAGFAWFAGNFSADALYLHRAPLVALVLTYPAGRASRRLVRPQRRLPPPRSFRRSPKRRRDGDPRGVPARAGRRRLRARSGSRAARLAWKPCARRVTSPSSSRQLRSRGSPARRTRVWRRRCSSTRPGSAPSRSACSRACSTSRASARRWASCWQSSPRRGPRRCATRSHAHSATRRWRSATGCRSSRPTSIRWGGSSSSHPRAELAPSRGSRATATPSRCSSTIRWCWTIPGSRTRSPPSPASPPRTRACRRRYRAGSRSWKRHGSAFCGRRTRSVAGSRRGFATAPSGGWSRSGTRSTRRTRMPLPTPRRGAGSIRPRRSSRGRLRSCASSPRASTRAP